MDWADQLPAPPISPGSSSTFQVVNGTAPFTYQVQGTGFSLDPAHSQTLIENTQERSITVHTDAAACGSGVLTAVDACLARIVKTIPTTIELKWDETNLVEEMGPNDSIQLQFLDGVPPFTFVVDGTGFYLDPDTSLKTITSHARILNIFTREACGSAQVTVKDSCNGILSTDVRSNNGFWVVIGENKRVIPPFTARFVRSNNRHIAIKGRYKTSQEWWGVKLCVTGPAKCTSWNPESNGHFALSYPTEGEPFNQIQTCPNGWVITYDNPDDTATCLPGSHRAEGLFGFGGYGPTTYEWKCHQ